MPPPPAARAVFSFGECHADCQTWLADVMAITKWSISGSEKCLGLGPSGASVASMWLSVTDDAALRRVVDNSLMRWAEQSAQSIAASEKGAPATCVSVVLLDFIECFAMGRTKANVNPPAPVPEITGAYT